MKLDFEKRFLNLGIEIPPPPELPPTFNFLLWKKSGNLLYLSGHGPSWGQDNSRYTGKVVKDISIDKAKEATKLCTLNLLQTCRQALGSLNTIKQVIEVNGFINCDPTFDKHSFVLNACSDFLVEIFEQQGKHTRTAIGVNSLPFNFSVEVKMIIETL